MTFPPSYSELYVLSDIHLGGRRDEKRNFQIFNRGERLANLIRHVAERRPDDAVALVLNGDIIDSLAEDSVPGYVAHDAEIALAMMNHLYSDPSFSMVWQSLASFVQTPGRHLVFVVGNHDIELALPVVESSIRNKLAHGKEDCLARIHFSTHGGGYRCQVAGAHVFCTHGNEIDSWNCVDFTKLGELANAINAGRTIDLSKWEPNAGTQLVVDVMNTIKRQFPFVDLLKPEVAAVASVVMALDKKTLKKVDFSAVIPVLKKNVRGRKAVKDLLGPYWPDLPEVSPEAMAEEVVNELLGPGFKQVVQEQRIKNCGASEDQLLTAAEKNLADGKKASELVGSDSGQGELMGWEDYVAGWIGVIPRKKGLRKALKDWLEGDRTFDVNYRDDYYKKMKKRVSNQIDFVITGHSHKPRALPLGARRYYYNCGTWIRTLRLTEEVLDDRNKGAFEEKVWPALTAASMEALDGVEIPGPEGKDVSLLCDRTNVVRISAEGCIAVGELLRVTDGKAKGSVNLVPESNTKPFKVGE
jgi:UDP-2,3-diacylglucosamine pyrophosphatase LpxH